MSEARPRVFLVDDEEAIRINLAAWLEDEGFEMLVAESGEEALDVLSRERADVGIFDMRLSDMDGNTLIQKVHEIQPDLKVIIYTGSIDYALPPELEALGIGPDQVFKKPVLDMALMVDGIRRLLEERDT